MFRKLLAFGLRNVEDKGCTKPNQNGAILSCQIFLGVFLQLAFGPKDRSKNADGESL
jgi:hypothetical protein